MPDRSYYRHEGDTRLIEEAKYNPNRELATALGERLEDVIADMDDKIYEAEERALDFQRDAYKLGGKIYGLRVEIDKLEMILDQRDRVIAGLEQQIEQLKKGN